MGKRKETGGLKSDGGGTLKALFRPSTAGKSSLFNRHTCSARCRIAIDQIL